MPSARIPYCDFNNSTLKLAHQPREDPLPTKGALPISLLPWDFTLSRFGSPIVDIMSQFLILIPGGLGFTTPFSLDPPSRTNFQCHQQATANSIDKTQISDFCWLTAFIQKLWKTAWDLLAHRNIEILGSGFDLPNLLHCCPWPKIPFTYWNNPQLSHPTHYSGKYQMAQTLVYEHLYLGNPLGTVKQKCQMDSHHSASWCNPKKSKAT